MTPVRPGVDRTCARPRSGDRSDNGQDTEARRARQGRVSGERSERSLDVPEHFRMLAHRSGRAHCGRPASRHFARQCGMDDQGGSDLRGAGLAKPHPQEGGRSPLAGDPTPTHEAPQSPMDSLGECVGSASPAVTCANGPSEERGRRHDVG